MPHCHTIQKSSRPLSRSRYGIGTNAGGNKTLQSQGGNRIRILLVESFYN